MSANGSGSAPLPHSHRRAVHRGTERMEGTDLLGDHALPSDGAGTAIDPEDPFADGGLSSADRRILSQLPPHWAVFDPDADAEAASDADDGPADDED